MPDILLHSNYIKSFLQYIYCDEESRTEVDRIVYQKGKIIRLCPEPRAFLAEMDDFADNSVACRKRFVELSRDFKQVDLSQEPPAKIWFNTTKNGINLRPGIDDSVTPARPHAIRMGDAAVHGLMAGQTGSGKSVLLHNLIFNLLAEYPPWELDLYLADFKRVEFSRYMNTYETPHVCACAATGEVRYVLSLIQYLVDCMNARETFLPEWALIRLQISENCIRILCCREFS